MADKDFFAGTKEQKKQLDIAKKRRSLESDILDSIKEMADAGLKLTKGQKERLAAAEKEAKLQDTISTLTQDRQNFEKDIHKMRRQGNAELKATSDLSENVYNSISDQAEKSGELSDLNKEFLGIINDLSGELKSVEEIDKIRADLGSDITEEMEEYLDGVRAVAAINEKNKAMSESIDEATGGMVGKAKDFAKAFATNPLAVMLTAATAILVKFSANLDAIGETFGAIGVKEFSSDLMAADAEMAKLGYDSGTAASITEELSGNFGVGVKDAMGMAVQVGDMSKALGLSVQEGSALMGTLTQIGGMTPQQAEDTSKMAAQLAQANNVNPSQVMKDIAGSSETFAKFGGQGSEELIKAAVHAAKLGTSLDAVAATMEGMLDFQDSTTKAMEASIMLGRDINVQKMQELSLAGDAAGVLEEQKRLLGDANDWEQLNVLEKKKLAEALGLTVEQAAKMVQHEGEAGDLAGELEKKEGFEGLVGKEALSALTQMQNLLTSIGATITSVLGPPLNWLMGMVTDVIEGFEWWAETLSFVTIPLQFMVGIVTEGINVISGIIGWLMEFPAIAGIVGAALIALNGQFLLTAISGVWAGVTSIMSIPFVGPVLAAAAAIGLISTIYKAIAGAEAKQVGDAFVGEGGGGPVVTTSQGSMEGSVRDEVLMAPGISKAGAAAGAGANGTVAAINKLTETTQQGIDSRPTAKDMGKEAGKRTGRALEQLGDG